MTGIKSFIKNIFFRFLFVFIRSKKRQTKYYFTICAIFKDEARYLKEWIEYHKIVGVDHIYLYNNFSEDNYLEVLKPYIDSDYVTLKEWPYEHGQISSYDDCYRNFRSETKWMTFIDIDEFICPKVKTDIKEWVKPFEKYPAVVMYWLMFGTSGIVEVDTSKLVTEQYTQSWADVRNVGKHVLNCSWEPVEMYHHHIFCKLHLGRFCFNVPMVNENKEFIFMPGKEKCPVNGTIQINHYWSKNIEEYVRKINKGDVFSIENDGIRKKMDFFYWHENRNVAVNRVVYRFLAQLKIAMNGIKVEFRG